MIALHPLVGYAIGVVLLTVWSGSSVSLALLVLRQKNGQGHSDAKAKRAEDPHGVK